MDWFGWTHWSVAARGGWKSNAGVAPSTHPPMNLLPHQKIPAKHNRRTSAPGSLPAPQNNTNLN